MFKIGVFAVILNKKKEVLLCHRRDCDLWNLPGGGLEKKESPWDGVVREVKEETGLEIEIKKLIGVYHKDEKKEIVFSFQCAVSGGKSVLSDEADQIMFFPYARLPKNISQKHKDRIEDALNNSKDVILKSQNFPDYLDLRK